MNYRKIFNYTNLSTWTTIAVMFVIWFIALHRAEAYILFEPAVNYDVCYDPSSVAIGDLNGDNNLDLAVACQDDVIWPRGQTLWVLLGNDDGTFLNEVNYYVGEAHSVAIGDLDGDSDLDLAVANSGGWSGHSVKVLLGNGDGTFQVAVDYSAGDGPRSVAIGDLDGDDDLDLAVANGGSHNVSVLLGNGDGSFQNAVNYGAGEYPWSVAIGDLDGDDDLDLAVANRESGNVSVLLGNGDGSFQNAVNYGTGEVSVSVAIGDLDGDSDLDLAVANGGSHNVSVLLGNGDGTFQVAVDYSAGDGPRSVAIGDLDGDDDLDLAVANSVSDDVSVLLGNGDGSFQSAVNYTADEGPTSVAIGDLNGDGKLDLAVANGYQSNNVSVFINTGGVANLLLYTPVSPCRIVDTRKTSTGIIGASTSRNFHVFGNSGTISAQGGNSFGCPAPSGEPVAVFINLVVASPTSQGNMQAFAVGGKPGANLSVNFADIGSNRANAGTVQTSVGSGPDITVASQFASAHAIIDVSGYYYPAGDLLYTPVTPCRIVDTRKTSAGIIGASTERDFHVFGDGTTISAQGGTSAGCPVPLGEPLAAHINMVVANPTGQGNMQAFAVGGKPGANLSVNFADIGTNFANAANVQTTTGSGPDITVTSRYSSAHTAIDVLGYYYPDRECTYPTGEHPSSVAIGDLDGDDEEDLVISNRDSNNVSVLLGKGDGTFRAAVNYGAGDRPLEIVIGDLDGDNDLDLVVGDAGGNVSVLLGKGDGTFQAAINFAVGGRIWSMSIEDLNGDDNLDLAVAESSILVLLGNGDGTFQVAGNYTFGDGNYSSVAIGDLNGDGAPDLAVALEASAGLYVLLGNGDGTFQAAMDLQPWWGSEFSSVAIDDLDEDDNLDLAVAVYGLLWDGGINIFLGNGDGTFNDKGVTLTQYGGVVEDGYGSVVIGDLNGDDNLDLAAHNFWDGYVHVGLGKGDGTFLPRTDYKVSGGTNGADLSVVDHLLAIGDLNGDDNLDLAVANKDYDNVSVLINTGGAFNLSCTPITVASRFASAHAAIDVLGYYFLYTPVTPCRIVDTRKTSAGMIGAYKERDFHVFGDGTTISAQGGTSAGCPVPLGEPLAAHINMVVANPTGQGNMQAFAVGGKPGANLSVNFADIGTNFANAGTVQTTTGSGPDITVTSRYSSAHTAIDVLGYYYPAP